MKTGIEIIAEERKRQVESEGYGPEHDDAHDNHEILDAARAYLRYVINGHTRYANRPPGVWPWESVAWKPSGCDVRNLAKAGALIAAEIDRLNRASAQAQSGGGE